MFSTQQHVVILVRNKAGARRLNSIAMFSTQQHVVILVRNQAGARRLNSIALRLYSTKQTVR